MKVKHINVRHFFRGLGSTDSKYYVNSLVELDELIALYPKAYQSNDLVWVVSAKSFYVIKVSGTVVSYLMHKTGGGNIYYGREIDVYDYIEGNQLNKPSLRGYKNGDGIILATDIGPYNRFDFFEVLIEEQSETYVFQGNLLGGVGPKGDKGDPGEKGDNLTIDEQGLFENREVGCSAHEIGWSYLAIDQGLLYFKTSEINQPCTWTTGIPFGRGDNGATTYFVFKRSTTQPNGIPVDTLAANTGWNDAPPTGSTLKLWMSKTTYSVDISGNPIGTIQWSSPVELDGSDGKDSGFWTIWSNNINPNRSLVKPVAFTLDLSGNTDWYDNISNNSAPIWMAQTRYNNTTKQWTDWVFMKVAGEKPGYKINLFKRTTDTAVNVPKNTSGGTVSLPYYQTNGNLTTGTNAAALAVGWEDAPPAGTGSLWFTEIALDYVSGASTGWSVPVKLDGDEGTSAGIWTIWSTNLGNNKPLAPNTDRDAIDIDLTGTDWVDDVGVNDVVVWMATSYYRPVSAGVWGWTDWVIVKVAGEKGADGDPAVVPSYDPVKDNIWYNSFEPVDTTNNYLNRGLTVEQFITLLGNPEATGTSGKAWSIDKVPITVPDTGDILNSLMASAWIAIHISHRDISVYLPDAVVQEADQSGWWICKIKGRAAVNWGFMVYGQDRFPTLPTKNLYKLNNIRIGDLVVVKRDAGVTTGWSDGVTLRYVGDKYMDNNHVGGDGPASAGSGTPALTQDGDWVEGNAYELVPG